MCSFVEILHAVLKLCPTKICATFYGPPDIYLRVVGITTIFQLGFQESCPAKVSKQEFYWLMLGLYVPTGHKASHFKPGLAHQL